MDLAKFIALREKQKIKLHHSGNGLFLVTTRRYSPDDGSEVDPIMESFTVEKVQKSRDDAAKAIAAYDALLDAMKEEMAKDAT